MPCVVYKSVRAVVATQSVYSLQLLCGELMLAAVAVPSRGSLVSECLTLQFLLHLLPSSSYPLPLSLHHPGAPCVLGHHVPDGSLQGLSPLLFKSGNPSQSRYRCLPASDRQAFRNILLSLVNLGSAHPQPSCQCDAALETRARGSLPRAELSGRTVLPGPFEDDEVLSARLNPSSPETHTIGDPCVPLFL